MKWPVQDLKGKNEDFNFETKKSHLKKSTVLVIICENMNLKKIMVCWSLPVLKFYIFWNYFFQDEQLKELHNMIEMEEEGCEAKFKQVFEQLQSGKKSISIYQLKI